MPGELSLVPLLLGRKRRAAGLILLSALALPVAALALEALGGRRFWCRYVCPQSVLLGLAARCLSQGAPGLRVIWRASACTCKGETPCRAACSLALNPRRAAGPPRRDCVMCGDCLKACAARGGALRWSLRAASRRGSKDGGGNGG
ncbi:MAG: 4Fe-4S binding protein [Desulfovibrio fairfieldensis]